VTGPSTADFGAEWSASLRRGTDEELRSWVDAALGWCDETDAIALRHFRQDVAVAQKPDRTFVTVADTSIERRLRGRIADAFPGHLVVGEELGADAGDAGAAAGDVATRWYIDPIDGTHNYIRGIPIFATLLAVERDGELQAAVISAPALRERWWAWRGGGAWAGGGARTEPARIHASRIGHLADAQVLYTSPIDLEGSGKAPGFRSLLEGAWRDRGFGDFWSYTLVAEGAAEAMLEVDLKTWDAAAPTLLVEEAGGRVTDFDGHRRIDSRTILATNGHLHDAVRSVLVGREETSR
jgi:histidinol-phosphatase